MVALVLHWVPFKRLRPLFLENWMPTKTGPFVVVALVLHWVPFKRMRLLASMLKIHFLRLPSLSGGCTKIVQREEQNFTRSFPRCHGGFTFFLRFAFWGFPRCYAGFILADLSAWTCCFFNFQNFDSHIRILISFASKTAECDSHPRNQSTRATLTIRNKILILVQGFSSVPFKT